MADLKARLSRYLDIVKAGGEVIVTDRGRAVARINPLADAPARDARAAELVRAGLARPPERPVPRGFLRRPRPRDARGATLSALLDERAESR